VTIYSCDVNMVALCFSLLLNAIRILGTGLIWRRCFDGLYTSIISMANEADDSGSLDLFNAYVENCGSASTLGVTELFAMGKIGPELHLG
jgi:hypothetical protein